MNNPKKKNRGGRTINNVDTANVPDCYFCGGGVNERAMINFKGEIGVCENCACQMVSSLPERLRDAHRIVKQQFGTIQMLRQYMLDNGLAPPVPEADTKKIISDENAKSQDPPEDKTVQ